MFFKIARRIAWKFDWVLLSGEAWVSMTRRADNVREVETRAAALAATAELLIEENKQLRTAYDALLEEFTELTEGRTW